MTRGEYKYNDDGTRACTMDVKAPNAEDAERKVMEITPRESR